MSISPTQPNASDLRAASVTLSAQMDKMTPDSTQSNELCSQVKHLIAKAQRLPKPSPLEIELLSVADGLADAGEVKWAPSRLDEALRLQIQRSF